MTSTATTTPFVVRVTNYLPLIERIFLVALVIGTILMLLKIDSTVVKVSLLALAVTFFFSAFRPPQEIIREENELLGFSDLLALMILPKVLWISTAVSALGIAFFLIDFGNQGYKQLLMIGGSTLAILTILVGILSLTGVKHLKVVAPILLRAIPLAIIAFYILLE